MFKKSDKIIQDFYKSVDVFVEAMKKQNEPEVFKITETGFYRDDNGDKVHIFFYDGQTEILGCVEGDPEIYSYAVNGTSLYNKNIISKWD